MRSRFPDLTFFLDTAGRYSHSKQTPIVVCAVSIETEAIDEVRQALVQSTGGTAVKWSMSDGDHYASKEIYRLLAKRQLFWVVRTIWKNTPKWDRFFEEGNKLYDKVVKKAQEAATYAKPMNTFKLHQFGLASADLLGFYLGRHPRDRPRINEPIQRITVTAVHDSDIEGQVNQKVFRDVLEGSMKDLPRTVQATRILPSMEVLIKTEQQEPLLLLPDHIAGYHYSSKAYGHEKMSSLLTAIDPMFRQIPNSCYKVIEEQFQEDYLLPPTTFDYVLPKEQREALLRELFGEQQAPA